MRATHCFGVLVIFVVNVSCIPDRHIASDNAIRAFSDRSASAAQVRRAAVSLRASSEVDAAFWANAANDETMDMMRRRIAVFMLWDRCVHPGDTLLSAGTMFRGARWMETAHVEWIAVLAGQVPVEFSPGYVYWIQPWLQEDDRSTIYLRIDTQIEPETLRDALQGKAIEIARSVRILEVGIAPTDPSDKDLFLNRH